MYPPIVAIETHCFNIRELVLDELDEDNMVCTNLWEHVGPTLERLSVEFPCASEEDYKIQKYCRKLTHVHIDQPAYDSEDEEEGDIMGIKRYRMHWLLMVPSLKVHMLKTCLHHN